MHTGNGPEQGPGQLQTSDTAEFCHADKINGVPGVCLEGHLVAISGNKTASPICLPFSANENQTLLQYVHMKTHEWLFLAQ